jgi:hypothetical protein
VDLTVPFFADKSIGIGVSVLGTNEAVAQGAYALALHSLDGPRQPIGYHSGTRGGQKRKDAC